jgi:hypothetical protein
MSTGGSLVVGFIALLMGVIFATKVLRFGHRMSRTTAAKILEDFVAGKGGPYDFDTFLSVTQDDPEVESARQRCLQLMAVEFPDSDSSGTMSIASLQEITEMARRLKEKS